MKDLTKYIESLFDDVDIPMQISLQEDGSYKIVLTNDLKFSNIKYDNAKYNSEDDIRYVRVQIKKYLPNFKVKLLVEYINYPKIDIKPIIKEYKYGAWKIN
jgi:hypothetical protein